MKIEKTKTLINFKILLFVCVLSVSCFSQDYRNEKAYITDFNKNEYHLNTLFSEYLVSIKEGHTDIRINSKLKTILLKLKNLNAILLRNDKGLFNDVTLRNSLIKLNNLTIELIKNNTFDLTNYEEMANYSTEELPTIFDNKEKNIHNYYIAISEYEETKYQFCKKHKISITKEVEKKNILEYTSIAGLYFYEISVVDRKLTLTINNNNSEEATICFAFLKQFGPKLLAKNTALLVEYKDTSLNLITDKYIKNSIESNTILYTSFKKFQEKSTELQKGKELYKDEKITDAEYTVYVRAFNESKNNYYNSFEVAQKNKATLVERWHETNATFMSNNIKFDKE